MFEEKGILSRARAPCCDTCEGCSADAFFIEFEIRLFDLNMMRAREREPMRVRGALH